MKTVTQTQNQKISNYGKFLFLAVLFFTINLSCSYAKVRFKSLSFEINQESRSVLVSICDSTKKPQLFFNASDSVRYDKSHGLIKLYGNATVSYRNVSVSGQFIVINKETYDVYATGTTSKESGNKSTQPKALGFERIIQQTDSLKVNLKTKQIYFPKS